MARHPAELRQLLRKVGPIPELWASRYFDLPIKNSLDGLIWPHQTSSPWLDRISQPSNKFLPWALWAGFSALNIDTPSRLLSTDIVLQKQGPPALLNQRKLGFAHLPSIDYYLRLGDSRNGWLTPGQTLEEQIAPLGYQLVKKVAEAELPMDWQLSDHARYRSLEQVLELEATRCRNWIDADPLLGLTCILGPLSRRALPRGERYRHLGVLGKDGEMTKYAWWRLATSARQGIGMIEHYRAFRLSPHHRSWVHMRRIQQFALQKWEQEGWLPLGLEYSALGFLMKTLPHRYRPDLLLITPQQELVWYEYMRRPLRYIKTLAAIKYRHLPQDFLPMLASLINHPVIFVYQEPQRVVQQTINDSYLFD